MKHLQLIIIAGLLLYILYLQSCTRTDCPKQRTETVTITVPGDTVFTEIKRYVPVPKYITRTQIDTVIDTVRIIEDYHSIVTYSDTIFQSEVELIINDTLQYNRISAREVMLKNTRPIQVEQHFPETSRFKLFLGASAGGRTDMFNATLDVNVVHQDKFLYGYSYGLDNTHWVRMGWKLSFRTDRE